MMRQMQLLAAIVAAVGLLALPAAAESVEEVIAKHVLARGGDKWNGIQTMQVSGTFTAFSKVSPFTLHRKRGNLYHLDHTQNERKVEIGYDGETAWWDNHWFQPGAQKIDGPDLAVVLREADFVTPFFEYKERGWEAKLLGETEIEGFPAIGIELTRDDGLTETWYLDPETHLELARVSPGSDFGQPMDQRTFFDDFREIDGVMVPHLTETQWYTRDRVMHVDSVKFNVPVDDEIFRMPAPPGMGPFMGLAGKWNVKVEQRQQPGAPWQESEREGEIESLMGNTLLQERFTTSNGDEAVWTLSYDRFKETYRYTSFNASNGQLNVAEGGLDDEGKLVVSNLETDTPLKQFGMTIHSRVSLHEITGDGFKLHIEVTIDGGENWFLAVK